MSISLIFASNAKCFPLNGLTTISCVVPQTTSAEHKIYRITTYITCFCYSADGLKIFFQGFRDELCKLYVQYMLSSSYKSSLKETLYV